MRPSAPSYASGIDNVPRDMLDVVHKGERIVPAAANDGIGTVNVIVNVAPGTDSCAFRSSAHQSARQAAAAIAVARMRG